jgi:hypothetical protein
MPDAKTQMPTDRPDHALAGGAPRLLNAAAWLGALAALEAEFKALLDQNASPKERARMGRHED